MATIKDVAEEAGLTVTTVSRVLNNRGYISENARKKVYEAMEKLNYKPNELARSLHNKKSNVIGVLVPHIRHPYFAEMISNLENEAYKAGYRILLCNTKDKTEKTKEYLDVCTSNRVAAVIIFSGSIEVADFIQLDIPIITMERTLDTGTASVECDNKMGGELAAGRLIDAGCKNVLYIGSTVDTISLPADDRGIGFLSVCKEKGIQVREIDPEIASYLEMSYLPVLESALEKDPTIDGVFASSDVIAAQMIQACHEIGKKIPEDLKIIGFDDTMIAKWTYPPLTTIHQPIREMAQMAIRYVKEASEGKMVPKKSVLPVALIERGSV